MLWVDRSQGSMSCSRVSSDVDQVRGNGPLNPVSSDQLHLTWTAQRSCLEILMGTSHRHASQLHLRR